MILNRIPKLRAAPVLLEARLLILIVGLRVPSLFPVMCLNIELGLKIGARMFAELTLHVLDIDRRVALALVVGRRLVMFVVAVLRHVLVVACRRLLGMLVVGRLALDRVAVGRVALGRAPLDRVVLVLWVVLGRVILVRRLIALVGRELLVPSAPGVDRMPLVDPSVLVIILDLIIVVDVIVGLSASGVRPIMVRVTVLIGITLETSSRPDVGAITADLGLARCPGSVMEPTVRRPPCLALRLVRRVNVLVNRLWGTVGLLPPAIGRATPSELSLSLLIPC